MTETERLAMKWGQTGLLDNITKKEEAATILETTAKRIIDGEIGSPINSKYNGKILSDAIKHLYE